MLSLYKLEIFSVVVQQGSFSKAAEQLLMTQSAISQHMQDLEAALGTRLFNRGRRGVTLTPSGEKLYDYTIRILHLVALAESDVMDVSKLSGGQTKIGSTPTVGIYLIPEWIRQFRDKYSNLTVSLQTDITANILQAVLRRQLDLGIVEGEIEMDRYPNLGFTVLREINMILIVGPNHPWWERETVSIDDLDKQPITMRQPGSQTRIWIDEIFDQYQIQPIITSEFDNPESIKQSVVMGHCMTLLPDYAIERELSAGMVKRVKVDGLSTLRSLKLVWDQQMPLAPIARAFVEFLGTKFPQLLEKAWT